MRQIVPEHVVARAAEYADGTRTPVEPDNAATVVLLRDGDAGPEAYLLKRQASMAFAAGMAVFPGGGVDAGDGQADATTWIGPTPAQWAERLETTEDLARALVFAAARETFEETGVLLAGRDAGDLIADTHESGVERERERVVNKEISFADFLRSRGLHLRTDLLHGWAGWLTPVFQPRRYRTWIFVARMPADQHARDVSTEAHSVTWLPLMEVVAQVESGELMMMPPTYLTCLEMGQHDTVDGVLAAAARRKVGMFTPAVIEYGDAFTLSAPSEVEALLEARP